MSDKHNFKTVSLRISTYSKLNDLKEILVPNIKISGAKAVEKLIMDKHRNSFDDKGICYEKKVPAKA
tara:strand:+ start:467 stop:667 length:201 start_codon:yes stop_codon:yes gene_type:complete